MRARFPVVFFDLDGTLLRGTTVSASLASWLGRSGELDALERDYAAGRVNDDAIALASAAWFTGIRVEDATAALADLPWIDGIEDVVASLPLPRSRRSPGARPPSGWRAASGLMRGAEPRWRSTTGA